ncbi:helix-turn-helix transcriptional regulator [Gluconacetobacter sacchari]|uniref:Helix-turn-helix transcriptional regulator n=2 Tax=Gluconacetobacter sacchari TaxID=92759 RepID=A0A7W4IA20_9PROT|nr:helix-turn-helix transcriptional regulator [Gluconacetobacter sacchari]
MQTISPTPMQIRDARRAAGMTQAEAAQVVSKTQTSWRRWEGGIHRMSPALFDYFLIETGSSASAGAQP